MVRPLNKTARLPPTRSITFRQLSQDLAISLDDGPLRASILKNTYSAPGGKVCSGRFSTRL